MFSLLSARARLGAVCLAVAGFTPVLAQGASPFSPQAGEYSLSGALPGDQVYPHVAIGASGGLVVWQDNATDGDGWGISAQRLNNNLSGTLATFRVNEIGAGNQENARVALLQNGGAVFVWQGGAQGFQKIYARFMAPDGTFATGDLRVNTYTNQQQINPALAVLADGSVVVAWASFDQDGDKQGVFAQRLSAAGVKLGAEFQVNQTTAMNQRNPAVAALESGGFLVVWVSEASLGVDGFGGSAFGANLIARRYDAAGAALSSEFRINGGADICASPVVSASAGGFTVAWSQRDGTVRSNGWDVFVRAFDNSGAPASADARVNSFIYGDQVMPKIESLGADQLVVWTSYGQDGSREGVFGRFVSGGAANGDEFRANSTTRNAQIHPAVAADPAGRFLVVWTSYQAGTRFDLFAQRYASTQSLPQLPAPSVSALSQSRLVVSWEELAGYTVASYGLYVDGSATPVICANNFYIVTGLAAGTTHSFRIDYLLSDGRRSSVSAAATGTTWGEDQNFDGLPDDWQAMYWGANAANWPAGNADSDGDGASNVQEFLAGTNPADAASVLRTEIVRTPQGLRLSWNTQPGFIYQVQTSSNFFNWTNLGKTRFAPGTSDSISVGVTGQLGVYRIIRVR